MYFACVVELCSYSVVNEMKPVNTHSFCFTIVLNRPTFLLICVITFHINNCVCKAFFRVFKKTVAFINLCDVWPFLICAIHYMLLFLQWMKVIFSMLTRSLPKSMMSFKCYALCSKLIYGCGMLWSRPVHFQSWYKLDLFQWGIVIGVPYYVFGDIGSSLLAC